MRSSALLRIGAELDQLVEPETLWADDLAAAHAAERAELEAAFALFGTPHPTPAALDAGFGSEFSPDERAELEAAFALFGTPQSPAGEESVGDNSVSAELWFRDPLGPTDAPANQSRPATPFPSIARRWMQLDPGVTMLLLPTVDWVVVALAAEFAALWGAGAGLAQLSLGEAASFLAGALSLKFGMWATGAYQTTPARIRAESGAGGLALGALLALLVAHVLAPDARAAAALAVVTPLAALLLAGVHASLAVWLRAAHRAGVFAETLVVVGATRAAAALAERARSSGEARVVAVADDRLTRAPAELGATPVCGDVAALLDWEGLAHADRIVIALPTSAEARIGDILQSLRGAPNRIDLLLSYAGAKGRNVERCAGAALICVAGRPRALARASLKRAFDVVGAGLLLALLAPALLGLALAIRLDSCGPALYRQRRHGFNNRVFTLLKFRTMRHDPNAAATPAVANDPRVTRIGKVLRRTGLDELPQLVNVLAGEMSLVGPRPHAIGMWAEGRELGAIVAEYAHRHRVKPGITGWAQINGARGPMATAAAVRQRLALDLHYVARASIWLDLMILARTLPIIVGQRA